jgi:hypothetical protein
MHAANWRWGLVALLLATLARPASAAEAVDPDWPCIQRKVPELSIAQMWSGPMPEEGWHPDAKTRALAASLVPRRVTPEEVAATAGAYADGLPPDARAEGLADLFAAVLAQINAERGQVIAGIARYAHRQQALADRVGTREDEIVKLQAIPDDQKDWDRIEELQDELAWDTRIFKERAQSLTYVCETPVLLEQRAFAIARTLAGLSL